MIRAVGFDFDGTLYPNWMMYLYSSGFMTRHFRLVMGFYHTRDDLRNIDFMNDLKQRQFEILARRLSIGVASAKRLSERYIYEAWGRIVRHVPLYDGVRRLMARLRVAGIRVGVLSDFPVVDKLRMRNIDHFCHCAVSSEDVGYLKPNSAPFRHLCRCLESEPQHTALRR